MVEPSELLKDLRVLWVLLEDSLVSLFGEAELQKIRSKGTVCTRSRREEVGKRD